jgi:hypothetical protein
VRCLLFEAAFGTQAWRELLTRAARDLRLELTIRARADQERRTVGALHALRWEALHDGSVHVAAKGAKDPADPSGRRLPVGIVRLVPAAAGRPGAEGGVPFDPIIRIPRVLYAIGSRLTDPRVRAGAEFMGIMRHLERNGGSIHPRVLESATAASLAAALEDFKPEVLHLIGHGRWFPADESVKLQLRAVDAVCSARHRAVSRELLGRGGPGCPRRVDALPRRCVPISLAAGGEG